MNDSAAPANAPEPTTEKAPVSQPPIWFTITAWVALVWNLMGLLAFVGQVSISQEQLAELPDAERALYDNIPMWASVAFGVAVLAGTLGCVALLLRRRWAWHLFVLSLVGVIVQNVHGFLMSDALAVYGVQALVMVGMIVAIGIGLILLSSMATARGWLR
ncbi:MAG: hypothetical protein D6753_17880 [Planctomycetota bacterium]|nr:MAG: hypothetical protein D6753_17880 [Planctomycetota bacterium]